MANKYWVGGAGTWDLSTTTHWSDTDGGVGDATAPGTSDDVFFTTLSNATAYTVTSGAGAVCRNITTVAPLSGNMTLTSTAAITVHGSVSYYAGMLKTGTAAYTFAATTTGQTLDFGSAANSPGCTFNGVGGEWTFNGDYTGSSGTFTLTAGSVKLNGHTWTGIRIDIFANANAKALDLGSGTLGTTGNSGRVNMPPPSATWSFTPGTGTIDINVTQSGAFLAVAIRDNTFYNLTIRTTAVYGGALFTYGSTIAPLAYGITVTNQLAITGANVNSQRAYAGAAVVEFPITITCNGTVSLTNCDMEDVIITGSAAPASGTSVGDCGGCSGVTFTTPVTRYKRGGSGNAADPAMYDSASGGAGPATVPLPQDALIFDANSFTAGGQTFTINVPAWRVKSLDFTNVSNSPTLALTNAVAVYGTFDLTGLGALTGTGQLNLRVRSGTATLNTNAKTILGITEARASGGIISLAGAVVSSAAINWYAGTIATNDFGITCTAFNMHPDSNYGTGTFNFGLSLITLTGTGNVWGPINTNASSLTMNTSTAVFKITDGSTSQKVFVTSGTAVSRSYGKVWFSGATGIGVCYIQNSTTATQTIGEIQVDNAPRVLQFTSTRIINIALFTVNGSLGNLITMQASTAASAYVLVNTSSVPFVCDFLSVKDCTARPGNTSGLGGYKWFVGAGSTNVSNNKGMVFGAPGANKPQMLS